MQKNYPNNGYTSLVAKTKVKKSMGAVGVSKNQGSESKFHGTVAWEGNSGGVRMGLVNDPTDC